MQVRYRFLFLMDPYTTLNLKTETSLLLMTELIARGHQVFWLEESGLCLHKNLVHGNIAQVMQVRPLQIRRSLDDFTIFGS